MKRKIFIIAVIIIGLAAVLGSCKKKTVEPTSDTDPTSAEDIPICTHDSLFYVAAKQPTGDENGCIAHYKCPHCGTEFADASATIIVENSILWATNYVFDSRNTIENDFDEWAGDESYLLRACHGNIGGLGDEGSLYGNYTGWEDWTDAEWQAYWDCINDYYVECGGEGGINTSPASNGIKEIFSFFFSKIINKKNLKDIDEQMKAFFEGEDNNKPFEELNKRLDTVMMKADEIQASINELTRLIVVNRYRDVMNHRYEKMVGLLNTTYDYFNPILRMIAAEHPDSLNKLSDSTKYKIRLMTEFWHKTPVGGTLPELEMMNLLQFMKGDFVTGCTMPQIYDSIARYDAAWEHQAYAFREMTRTVDVVVMAQCYVMNLLYYKTHPEETYIDPTTNKPTFLHQNTINLLMFGYVDALKNSPIDYYDYYVCQIPGAKVNVEKKLKQLDPYSYILEHKVIFQKNNYSEWFREWLLPNGGVDKNWANTVYKYYAERYPREASNNSEFLYDKLREAEFENMPQAGNGNQWIIADCSCDWNDPGNNYYRRFVCKVFMYYSEITTSKKDWLGFHTVLDKKDGRCYRAENAHDDMYKYVYPGYDLPAISGMTIARSDGEITDKGTPGVNTFYAIELHK